jgi:hypothetical protein
MSKEQVLPKLAVAGISLAIALQTVSWIASSFLSAGSL